jgi:signal transduction histidine kinase
MEKCEAVKGFTIRKTISESINDGYFFLVKLGKKYLSLVDQSYEFEYRHEKIRAENEQLLRQVEQLQRKNEDLERQNTNLEHLNQERDNFVGSILHDLRAPLNRSKSLSKMLYSGNLNEEQREIINFLTHVNDEGLHLVEQLLQISSLEYENHVPITFDLGYFLHEHIQKFFVETARHKNIMIHTAFESDIEITMDLQVLKRIIDNIVSNALKFSKPGTSIFIKTLTLDDMNCISVRDQGPGISDEDQAKLFRRFQKLSARPTSGESSTGLGLSIVKGLVEKQGGKIAVHSRLGFGAEFTVSLKKDYEEAVTKELAETLHYR